MMFFFSVLIKSTIETCQANRVFWNMLQTGVTNQFISHIGLCLPCELACEQGEGKERGTSHIHKHNIRGSVPRLLANVFKNPCQGRKLVNWSIDLILFVSKLNTGDFGSRESPQTLPALLLVCFSAWNSFKIWNSHIQRAKTFMVVFWALSMAKLLPILLLNKF